MYNTNEYFKKQITKDVCNKSCFLKWRVVQEYNSGNRKAQEMTLRAIASYIGIGYNNWMRFI